MYRKANVLGEAEFHYNLLQRFVNNRYAKNKCRVFNFFFFATFLLRTLAIQNGQTKNLGHSVKL